MTPSARLERFYATCPLVFARGGARVSAPANTLPAFFEAVKQGAHGAEVDVQRTKDGVLVAIHDFTVDAATDGSGRVTEMTLAELKALDAGARYAPSFTGTPIPTLDEVFAAVGAALYLNVEIKSNTAHTDGVEAAVADCIRRHQMHERVLVSSLSPLALRRFRALMPDVPLAFVYGEESPQSAYALMEGFTVEALHAQETLITQAVIDKAHAAGQRVHAWTVNEAQRARRLATIGIDGILTDAPARILRALYPA